MSKLVFLKDKDIFDSKCESIVCPVNSLSIMGAGLAKAFKEKQEFNRANNSYKTACDMGMVSGGSVLVFKDELKESPFTYIIYLATKFDYRDLSLPEYIENGLLNLFKTLHYYKIQSVAIPAIGCGFGGMKWEAVEPMIKTIFENDDQKDRIVEVYLPH